MDKAIAFKELENYRKHEKMWERSHGFVDIVGVTGSIPVAPTILHHARSEKP